MVPAYLQVILALAIVIILFVIGFSVYNYEYLRTFRTNSASVVKQKVVIFDGVKDLGVPSTKDDTYNTQNKATSQYRELTPSYNQAGGIEYTYNFWLYMGTGFTPEIPEKLAAVSDAGFTTPSHQTVLFVRGSKNIVNYKNICGTTKNDIMVKSPLVKLEDFGKVMTIEFNTLQGPDAVIENAPPVCSELTNDWYVANAHKLSLKGLNDPALLEKYNMFTVIVQDTFPQDPLPYRNKVRCRVFVNGLLKLDKYVDGKLNAGANQFSTLKTNSGNLIIAPTISVASNSAITNFLPTQENKLRLANMSYFNYAVTQAEIDKLYSSGYDNTPAKPDLNIVDAVPIGSAGDAKDISTNN